MILTISSLYGEPGYDFSISYKVDNLIRDKLRDKIMTRYKLDKKDKDIILGVIISTNSKIRKVEVKGPDFDKKNKTVNWGLWLPFEEIARAKNQLSPYLKYLFDALVILFKKYNVNENNIRDVQNIIQNEVINNSEYDFKDYDDTEPLDLTKLT